MAQRGRPPMGAAAQTPKDGVVINKISSEEVEAGKALKNEKPEISYEVLKIIRDGKKVVKVRKVESRLSITDQSLVFQSVNGKPVRQVMTAEELKKAGVDLSF